MKPTEPKEVEPYYCDGCHNIVKLHPCVICTARKARDFYDEQAKERQKEHGGTAPGKSKNTGGKVTTSDSSKARDAAGKAIGVSGSLVDLPRIPIDENPEKPIMAHGGRIIDCQG